uniref:Actin-related protein 2/3 complex subunit n=1 Tax=Acrobeloides nanus TaxID=290746 RepID=A0A914EKC2_9BILA
MSQSPVQSWDLGIGPIYCHAFNKDRTQLAVSSSNLIQIYQLQNGAWKEVYVLKEHDLPITGLDWAPNTNRIVSCSQDKNVFVWTFDNGNWKPELVLVRINRGATTVKWSPLENKFAVGSSAKLVAVCYYERENDWWVSKHLKKPIRSTVTAIDWHPNNVLLAVGATDFRARVFSAYVKEVDEKPSPNPWGSKMPFGQVMAEYVAAGWIKSVSFSPSGCRLAWVAQDSTLSLVDANQDIQKSATVQTTHLPYATILWVTENSLVVAGFDCSPMLYTINNGTLSFVSKLDVPPENKNANSIFQKFRNVDRNALETLSDLQLKSLHQNAIVQLLPHTGNTQNIVKFTTCGSDGLVALWDLKNNRAVVH